MEYAVIGFFVGVVVGIFLGVFFLDVTSPDKKGRK